jgi:hypothetical protein
MAVHASFRKTQSSAPFQTLMITASRAEGQKESF